MAKIKICGIRSIEDAVMISSLFPDYIGMVIECPNSKRSVSESEAVAISENIKKGIEQVGVFADAKLSLVLRLLKENVIDIAQLHGNESRSYIDEIEGMGFRTIKAFSYKRLDDAYSSNSSFVLIDADVPGSGKSFYWKDIHGLNRPFFLAGGINADNAVAAIRTLSPYALDSASGTESNGKKDKELSSKLIDAVRNYNI